MYKTSTPKAWRKYSSRYRILGVSCKKCSKKYYPAVFKCAECQSSEFEPYAFKHSAKLITWSQIHAAPTGFEGETPYIIAIVELEDGERMTSQIVDIPAEELVYGMELKATFRKIFTDGNEGSIHYGIKFTPVQQLKSTNIRDCLKNPKVYVDQKFIRKIIEASELDGLASAAMIGDFMSGPGQLGVEIKKQIDEKHMFVFLDSEKSILSKVGIGNKIVSDVTSTPFSDNTFDVIFIRFGLKYLSKKLQLDAVRELYRVLKPGGKLVVADMVSPNAFSQEWLNKQHFMKQQFKLGMESIPGYILTQEEWVHLFDQAGFEVSAPITHTSVVDTYDWLASRQIDKKEHEELNRFILDAPKEIKDQFNIIELEDSIEIVYPLIIIQATKLS